MQKEYQAGVVWNHFKNGNIQRPLWASTSTKNPAYRDVKYVEELIGPDTINTMPPETVAASALKGVVIDPRKI